MKRPITTSLLAAVLATSVAAPAGAQFAGLTTIEPEVLDPGAEPRQELRYRYVEGQSGAMAMDMTMDIADTFDGMPVDEGAVDLSMSAELTMTVTDVYDDGSARIEQVFSDYSFGETGDPVADAELEAASELLEGLMVWQVLDDRGAVQEVGSDAFEALPPELLDQVYSNTYTVQPFPEEAVGVGARWVASGTLTSQGLPMSMSIESEVLELREDGAVLGTDISADAVGTTDLLGDMMPGVSASIDRLEMSGGGTVEVAFDTIIPTSEAELLMGMDMTVSGGEGEDAFSYSFGLDMDMAMDVYPIE